MTDSKAARGRKKSPRTYGDGLGNIVKQVADLGKNDTFTDGQWPTDGDDQITAYAYGDAYSAKLPTTVTLPDTTGSADAVSLTCNLDGTPVGAGEVEASFPKLSR
jgi:hypothetical protein